MHERALTLSENDCERDGRMFGLRFFLIFIIANPLMEIKLGLETF